MSSGYKAFNQLAKEHVIDLNNRSSENSAAQKEFRLNMINLFNDPEMFNSQISREEAAFK